MFEASKAMDEKKLQDGESGDAAATEPREAPRKELTSAARRALAEAEARRAAAPAQPEPPKEIGGPKGPEPVRYGDWEVKGRAIDF
jgi:hypothetical protein